MQQRVGCDPRRGRGNKLTPSDDGSTSGAPITRRPSRDPLLYCIVGRSCFSRKAEAACGFCARATRVFIGQTQRVSLAVA